MLSNLSAADWSTIGLEVFRPSDYEQPSGPAWQSANYQPDGDPDVFLPDPYLSDTNYLGTSNPTQEQTRPLYVNRPAAAYHF
jgi:hypothetical protein